MDISVTHPGRVWTEHQRTSVAELVEKVALDHTGENAVEEIPKQKRV